ncbi:hypothetical protein [Hugenholtzia roseola]|uniref:hypothetical protein n=1 Tax=Hugenholtzia roseola TaxID=1002 RepID=UPI001376DAAB|nr:hypothetical protein [Hugenholtzia roseola]
MENFSNPNFGHIDQFYPQLATSLVRGLVQKMAESPDFENTNASNLPAYFTKPLIDLTPQEMQEIVSFGVERRFEDLLLLQKRELSEVEDKIFSVMRGIQPDNLFDVGGIENSLLWQLAHEFRFLPIFSLAADKSYTPLLLAMHQGGMGNLSTKNFDNLETVLGQFANNHFDVALCSEYLYKAENWKSIATHLCRMVKRFVIFVFPKKDPRFEEKALREFLKSQDIFQIRLEQTEDYFVFIGRK